MSEDLETTNNYWLYDDYDNHIIDGNDYAVYDQIVIVNPSEDIIENAGILFTGE